MRRSCHRPAWLTIVACTLCTCMTAMASPTPADTSTISDPLGVAIEAQRNYDAGMEIVSTDAERAHALFAKSAELYQRLSDVPIANGELSYNLGNAWIQAGNAAKAIAALLDAQLLLPGDERVEASLAHARSLVNAGAGASGSDLPLDRAAAWWSWLAPSARGLIAAGMWGVLWILVAFGVWSRWNARLPWRTVAVSLAFTSVAATATVVADVVRTQLHPPGVITSDSTVARKGNGEGFAPAFSDPLKAGAEFSLIEARPQWVHVRLSDGQSAWLRSSDTHVAGSWTSDRMAIR